MRLAPCSAARPFGAREGCGARLDKEQVAKASTALPAATQGDAGDASGAQLRAAARKGGGAVAASAGASVWFMRMRSV